MAKACKLNGYFGNHGKRESNTLVICPEDEDNPKKFGVILDGNIETYVSLFKAPTLQEEPMAYQLVGEVKAHQGYDM